MSELQHPDARPFESVAGLYERFRPEYPPDAVAWIVEKLDLREGRRVLDLGAGTGKLTRALVETGAHVIAVEPGEAMLAELIRGVPEAEAVHGAAEAIPFENGSVDGITVGQAFHWFRHDEALPEMHRILQPGGGVALIWNARDPDVPVTQELKDLLAEFVPSQRAAPGRWSDKLRESALFGALEDQQFRFAEALDADTFAGRIMSISFVAAAPAKKQAELEGKLRELVAAHGGTIELPYLTDVYVSYAV